MQSLSIKNLSCDTTITQPANLRTAKISSSGFKAFVEEQLLDDELGHITESINFLEFDSSSRSFNNSAYNENSSQLMF